LRRFARLLTGNQAAGDAAVARVLQAMLADPSIFPDLPPRLGLYQCFLEAFTTRLVDKSEDGMGLGPTAARSLAALSPQARQAFLLVTVEEFSPHQPHRFWRFPTDGPSSFWRKRGPSSASRSRPTC
jgi:hypothetical protein